MQPHKQLVDAFCAAKQIKANTRFTDVKGKFFKCQITLPGHADYSAQGGGPNKEIAEEKACDELVQYLQVCGEMDDDGAAVLDNITEVKEEDNQHYEEEKYKPQQNEDFQQGGLMRGGSVAGGFQPHPSRVPGAKVPPGPPPGLPPSHSPQQRFQQRQQQQHQQNLGQKRPAEQISGAENGGYTMENARSGLNLFLQKNRQPTDIDIQSSGAAHCMNFTASMKVYIPRFRRTLYAQETAKNKKLATNKLALNLVTQLYKCGAISSMEMSTKRTKATIKPSPCNISGEMGEKIAGLLHECNIQAVVVPEEIEEPLPLILPDEQNIGQQDTEIETEGRVIEWSPPSLAYDPWLSRTNDVEEAGPMWNPEHINNALLEERAGKLESEEFKQRLDGRQQLPVNNFAGQVLEQIERNRCVLIRGGTGCGKSTQVPQFILDSYIKEGRGADCNIVITQPRRISAISIAERVAWERYEEVSESVGYSVRFDSQLPRAYASILYCTTGTLLRKLNNGLHGISHVVVDEIHERDVNTDFLLIILRDMLKMHKQLKVVLMSATVDVDLFRNYFKCPVIEVPERTFTVDRYFLEDAIEMLDFVPPPPRKKNKNSKKNPLAGDDYCVDSDEETEECKQRDTEENCNLLCDTTQYKVSTAQAMSKMSEREFSFELVEKILDWIREQPEHGSVLVFLPGWNHIFALQKYLQQHPIYGGADYWLLPLHSQIPKDEQKRVFVPAPEGFTKIILATNIAETSITINDCIYVIDLCKAKIKEFFIKRNLADYRMLWASQTNLEQRAGRAGRVRPGVCFHLCSRARYEAMPHHISPEIQRTALHSLALTIKALNLGNVEDFLGNALEAPPKSYVANAITVLHEMGALNRQGDITPMGHCLAMLPLEPRLSQTILMSCLFRCGDPMITMAAASCFREPWIQQDTRRMSWHHKKLSGNKHSDHIAMLNAYTQWEQVAAEEDKEREQRFCDQNQMSSMTLQMIHSAKLQLVNLVLKMGFPEECLAPVEFNVDGRDRNLDIMTAMLAAGLYPNICIHHEKRKLWVSETQQALMHKSSVNCTNGNYIFPSPYFAYGEKIKTKVIAAKTTTMVSPLHLILFGSSSVVFHGDRVLVDEWIPLDMPGQSAALLCGLRKALEGLLMRVAVDPQIAAYPAGIDSDILEAVYALSDPRAGKFFQDTMKSTEHYGGPKPGEEGAPPPTGGPRGRPFRGRGDFRGDFRGRPGRGLPKRPGLPSRPGSFGSGGFRGGRGGFRRGAIGGRGGFNRRESY